MRVVAGADTLAAVAEEEVDTPAVAAAAVEAAATAAVVEAVVEAATTNSLWWKSSFERARL